MRFVRSHFLFGALGALLVMGAAAAAPVLVLRHPDPSAPLPARLDWARSKAAGPEFRQGYWVGISILRSMSEHSYIGSWSWPRKPGERTLEEWITGKIAGADDPRDAERTVKEAARTALAELEGRTKPDRIVSKDIGILLRFGPKPGEPPAEIEICDLKLFFNPKNIPLIWLGRAADGESVAFLEKLYAGPASEEVKKDLIQAIALHQAPGLAVGFLERACAASTPEPLRREAAEALGEQDHPRAVEILRRLFTADRSLEVRKEAVSALAESPVPAALDVLIEAALKADDKEVREEAVSGLADKASEKAVQTLSKIAFDDKDTEVQREAVSALADLPPAEALAYLTRIAKTHENPEVRKAAISALGDMGGPDAVAVLVDIVKGRK